MSDKQDNIQYVPFQEEDFSPDTEYNIIIGEDSTGYKFAIDTWKYAIYFLDNIQRKEISKDYKYIDGIRLDKFIGVFLKGKHTQRIVDFISDKRSCSLYNEIYEKHKVHINWVALYGLCSYIHEIISRRLAVLLKPSIKDTISAIGGVDNIENVCFTLKDGNNHNTDFWETKQLLWDALKNSESSTLGLQKIVRKVDVYTREYGEIEFVRYISKFFHDYFTVIKRRKNSYLTATEQKIICFLLNFFEFTKEQVSLPRYRQLFNSTYEPIDHFMPLNIPGFIKSDVWIHVEYIPYSMWSKGKINPLNEKNMHKENFLGEFTMQFGENPDISMLIDIIDGIIGKPKIC